MARTTSFLSLSVWNNSTDPYSHTQLAANWDAIDAAIASPSNTNGYVVLPGTAAKTGLLFSPSTVVSGQSIIISKVVADAQPLFSITPAGKLQWGPGGSTSPDLDLYRSSAGLLATDQNFQAVTVNATTGFQVNGTALAASHLSNGTTGTGTVVLSVSPTLTGTPVAPTAAANTNTTQIATTAFVLGQKGTAVPLMDGTGTIGSSSTYSPVDHIHPTDTSRLSATAAAGGVLSGNYPNPGFASTTGTGAVVLAAGPTLTGVPVAPTAAVDTNTTQLATTAYVVGQGYLKSATAASTYAPLSAATFTGAVTSTGDITARNSAGTSVQIGSVGGVAGVNFDGTSSLTLIAVTPAIRASDDFQAVKNIVVDQGGTGAYLGFGATSDTKLLRQAAGVLRTLGSFSIGGAVSASSATNGTLFLATGGSASGLSGGGAFYVDSSGNLQYTSPGGTTTQLAPN